MDLVVDRPVNLNAGSYNTTFDLRLYGLVTKRYIWNAAGLDGFENRVDENEASQFFLAPPLLP